MTIIRCRLNEFWFRHFFSIYPNSVATSGHVMISARFLGGEDEKKARAFEAALSEKGVKTYMVGVGPGETFGNKTHFGLTNSKAMIAFCCDNYGQKTSSPHSSFGELTYAYENWIPVVPVRLSKNWPPVPDNDFDGGNEGEEQNKVIFKPSLVYSNWSNREWDAEACAEEVKKSLETLKCCPMKN